MARPFWGRHAKNIPDGLMVRQKGDLWVATGLSHVVGRPPPKEMPP